jgi:hypothetical protein
MDTPKNQPPETNPSSQENSQSEHERLVARLVTSMMNHYWADNDHLATRQAQLEDWIEDLVEFPIDTVEFACRHWRRSERRRPTPADIRSIVGVEMQQRHLATQSVLPQLNQTAVRERCAELYGTCPARYAKLGVVCLDECKLKVPYTGSHATWAC